MATLLVLHGPNLNLLGTREPDIYGRTTLPMIDQALDRIAQARGHRVLCFQSNAEHELINRVQQAPKDGIDFVIINPAGFTHTSVALRDALAAAGAPFIEVHLSNIFRREPFRAHSYFSDLAIGVISGLGAQGYEAALLAALAHLENQST
jgi:3-dehydroquinate dehydratase-2